VLHPTIRLLVWNLEWKRRRSAAGQEIERIVDDLDPDIACFTEVYEGARNFGHEISAEPDYGYPLIDGRRKVLLWSRRPWRAVDRLGHKGLPPGRFVSGITVTPFGDVLVIGICIPWMMAHVTTGRSDRAAWEDHKRFLIALAQALSDCVHDIPTLLLGDWNQTIPRKHAPADVFALLQNAIPEGFKIATAGAEYPAAVPAVDHIAHTEQLAVESLDIVRRIGVSGRTLSDHDGWAATLRHS
jgi:hypothetical protein